MSGMDRDGGRRGIGRPLAIALVLLTLTVFYNLMLRHFGVSDLPGGQHFDVAAPLKAAGQVYVEAVSVDALDQVMQIRVYLAPEGEDASIASDRDLILLVSHDRITTDVKLAAGDRLAVSSFGVGLDGGNVSDYPFDAYRAQLLFQLRDARSAQRLPVRVSIWEGLLGFNLHTTARPGRAPEDVELAASIARSGAFVMFALCAYGAMLMLALCALSIGLLTFGDMHRPEATLIGALAAIIFALPAFRNALPGAPPLGVAADMWVFLWTELAAVLALALLVFKWARSRPPP